ncbi:AMP-binding protein [Phenylobacterium sp. 20VBR1]|uniref:AMP-binding protein n=1 Tax=Phenylobacterium glaciei TaxID=2803784 RepID=A0A941HVL7_9CAUL|nr:AMP-binding protein [Phenylobacterium glaciei]MBR7618705.1 AMP-binding protein [Phenylobacterium glaciei]
MSRVLQAIAAHALSKPQAVALSGGDQSFTYAQLAQAIEDAAAQLAGLAHLKSPDAPVAVMLENGPAWVILDLALVKLGWPSLPIPGFFTPAQRDHAVADSGAGLLISAEDAGAQLRIAGIELTATPLATAAPRLPAGTAKITYTSGSTGQPKGVCLSQDQMEAVAASLVQMIGADYAGRHLPLLPLSILLENVAGLYATLIGGGRYHVLPPTELGLDNPFRPDLARLTAAIAGEGATSLILVPELLRAVLMVMSFTGARFPNLNLVAVGGAKVAPQLLAQAQALGLPVYEGYGLSECASVVTLNTPSAHQTGAAGRPLPHLTVEIDSGGEIIVSPRPFLGYAGGQPALGPVRTGDLGRFDADGFLHIDGRRANTIINAYGRNIAPEWVESELLAQAEIRQAIVFGEGQAQLGALLVPLAPDMAAADLEAAVARANRNLPAYAQIGRWQVRAPFDPAAGELTGNGRPRRAVLLTHPFVEAQA